MNILILMTMTTLSALATPAQEASSKILDDAEAIMFSNCLQNKSRSIGECSCYMKGLKQQMPITDYHFFMEALYFSNNNDKASFDKVMTKYSKNLEDLDIMSVQVTELGTKIETECSQGIKTKLPKPIKK